MFQCVVGQDHIADLGEGTEHTLSGAGLPCAPKAPADCLIALLRVAAIWSLPKNPVASRVESLIPQVWESSPRAFSPSFIFAQQTSGPISEVSALEAGLKVGKMIS